MDEPTENWRPLDDALELALAPVRSTGRTRVVLFSGGVDSGLLAWELRTAPPVSLFTVGVPGADDLEKARTAAPRIGLPWTGQPLADRDLQGVESAIVDELDGVDGPRRGIFVAIAAAILRAPAGLLLCGQGVDELFLGYAHYRNLPDAEASARSSSDLRRLLDDDWPRTRRIAAIGHRDLAAPFLDPGFVRVAAEVPIHLRQPGALTKPFFRRWARHRGLPEALADRPKRAVQYGSGVDRWLRRRHRAAA